MNREEKTELLAELNGIFQGAESVVLAVITQWPTKYDPINHPENNREKAHRVLDKMEEQGYITAEEHQAALNEDPYANIKHETIQQLRKYAGIDRNTQTSQGRLCMQDNGRGGQRIFVGSAP